MNTLKRVGNIKAPTLVLWGEKDELDPPETGRILHDALVCKKEFHLLVGSGHMGHMDPCKQEVFERTAAWALENL